MLAGSNTTNSNHVEGNLLRMAKDLEHTLLRLGCCLGGSLRDHPRHGVRCCNRKCNQKRAWKVSVEETLSVKPFTNNRYLDSETIDQETTEKLLELQNIKRRQKYQGKKQGGEDLQERCLDTHGNYKMSIVILLGLCRKFGFVLLTDNGKDVVYNPQQPELGLTIDLDSQLDSVSHTLLAWVGSRRKYEIIRIVLLEKIVKHVSVVKRHIRKLNIKVRTLFLLSLFLLFFCISSFYFTQGDLKCFIKNSNTHIFMLLLLLFFFSFFSLVFLASKKFLSLVAPLTPLTALSLQVNHFNPTTLKCFFLCVTARGMMSVSGMDPWYDSIALQWKTFHERAGDTSISLGKNSFSFTCLLAQQLERLAHGQRLLTTSYYFDAGYVQEAGTHAKRIFGLYTEACDRTLHEVLTSKGVDAAFEPFFTEINKLTDGRYDKEARTILQKFLVNVDDMQVRPKTVQVGNSCTLKGVAGSRTPTTFVDPDDDEGSAASKYGATNVMACYVAPRGMLMMTGHDGKHSTMQVFASAMLVESAAKRAGFGPQACVGVCSDRTTQNQTAAEGQNIPRTNWNPSARLLLLSSRAPKFNPNISECHGAPIYDPYHPLPGLPKFQDHLQQMKAVFKDLKDAENFFTEEETNQ